MTSSLPPVPAVSPGMAEESLAVGREAFDELREGYLRLAAAVEVAHSRHRADELVFADQHRSAGVNLVGALHSPADVSGIAEVYLKASAAQIARDARRHGLA